MFFVNYQVLSLFIKAYYFPVVVSENKIVFQWLHAIDQPPQNHGKEETEPA